VPAGFAAYARILHPAWRGHTKVRWRELSATPIEPESRFETLAAQGVHPPFTGTLDRGDMDALLDQLAPNTGGLCWFGVWAGFGWVPNPAPVSPLELPERPLLLYHGPLTAATALYDPFEQSPTFWWASDRSWCVASEIDFHSTYVGGSRGLVDGLLGEARIEVLEVPNTADVTD
jgi:hypothetical protein